MTSTDIKGTVHSTTWNKIKDKTMSLNTQVNLAESDEGSLEWLEESEYGKGIFFSGCNDKNSTSSEVNVGGGRKVQLKKIKALTAIWRSYPLHIAVVSYVSCFSSFSPIVYYFFHAMRKGFSRVLWYKEVN